MPLPGNFSGAPSEEVHRHFRNICIEFKKVAQSSKDIDQLQQEMERFMNAAKTMHWPQKSDAVYHKDEGEKIMGKVWSEFKRYIMALVSNQPNTSSRDLIEALSAVERLIDSYKVR